MIEKILKFAGGGTSRKQLREAEAAYKRAYTNASPEARKEAEALIQTGINYSSANPAVGRSARMGQAEIYNEASKILRGEERSPLTMNTHRVISDFYNANPKLAVAATTVAPATTMKKFYKYDAMSGLPWSGEDDTLEDRVKRLAGTLADNLAKAREAHNRGDVVRGIDATQSLDSYIQRLDEIANSDTLDARAALKQILGMARQIGLSDRAAWDDYFGELDDLSQGEKNYNKLKSQGYTDYDMSGYSDWVRNTATDKKLKFMRDKEGNIKVFNDDFSDYSGGALSLYNDDWTNTAVGSGYGDVLLIGADGKLHMGAIGDLDRNSSLYNQYTQQLATNRAERDKLYTTHKYNGMFSDAGDNGELFEALSDELGRSFNGADVSGLFNGSEKVFAVQGNGKGEMKSDEYGNLRFDGNTRFYSLDDNGQLVSRSWDDMRGLYNRSGYGETEAQMGGLTDLAHDIRNAETSITGDEDLMGRTLWDAMKGSWFGFKGWNNPYVTYAAWDDIKDDPSTFVKLVLDATRNVDGKIDKEHRNVYSYVKTNKELLANLDWTNKSKDYTVYMFKYLQQHPEVYNQLSAEQKQQWKELLRRYNGTDTIVEKHGGIIKAAKGIVLSGAGEDITSEASKYKGSKEKSKQKYDELRKKEQKATERGFDSIYAMEANDTEVFSGDTQMTASDIMRLTTMAQDVASIVASFVPGAGTGVAAGLGVTSMGTDLVADILDPAVSGGEVAKNLAVNAGFAVAGMIPGAKMGKVAKNVIKWAPRLMTIVAGAGLAMDESTLNTFKKIGDGSTNFTREDWKNISRVLQVASGAVRTGKGMYDSHKVGKATIASDNVELKGVKSTVGDSDMLLPKKTVDEINTKLKAETVKTEEDALNVLRGLQNESGERIFTDELAVAALKTPLLAGKKLQVGKFELVGTKGTIDEGKTYDNLRTLWNKDAEAIQRQSLTGLGRAAIWFGDKFGGGAYGGKQRAILGNPDIPNTKFVEDLAYQTWYNPMVDWKGLRNKSGLEVIPERVKSTPGKTAPLADNAIPSQGAENADLRKYTYLRSKLNPWGQQKPYNGTDEVADGIHVNPTRNEASIKGVDEVRRVAPKTKLSDLDKRSALKFAKQFGVDVKDQKAYMRFIEDLKMTNPDLYIQIMNGRPTINPNRWIPKAKQEYNFKDGGRINSYSHLRK